MRSVQMNTALQNATENIQSSHQEITTRPCVVADLPLVMAIDRASFVSPWRESSFLRELRNPQSRLMVAEHDGLVIGYLCAWLVADELQILNVATHPDHRRRGIARRLLVTTLAEARHCGARSAHLEVRRNNLPALSLYYALGFSQIGVRPHYYPNGEDALLLVCELEDRGQGTGNR